MQELLESLFGSWGTAAAALVAAVVAVWRFRSATEPVEVLIERLAPKVVLVVEAIVEATPTQRDDYALEKLEGWIQALGQTLTPQQRDYARGVIEAAFRKYILEHLGQPAHVKPAAARARYDAEAMAAVAEAEAIASAARRELPPSDPTQPPAT